MSLDQEAIFAAICMAAALAIFVPLIPKIWRKFQIPNEEISEPITFGPDTVQSFGRGAKSLLAIALFLFGMGLSEWLTNASAQQFWTNSVSNWVSSLFKFLQMDKKWAINVGIGLITTILAGILLWAANSFFVVKKVANLTSTLKDAQNSINLASDAIFRVRDTSLEDLRLATHTVSTALSLRADPKIEQNSSSTIGRFYQTLGAAIDQWRITAEEATGPSEFDYFLNLRDVVLRLGACYLRQEAIAAEGKYVTTSGRNYVEMLISVVDELLRQVPKKDDYKVHYVAVTTASPLDFYNWPNRGIDGAGRWEAPYLRLFRHTLHALIHDKDLKDHIEHSRIVLTAKDEAVTKMADSMSWELSLDEDIQSDLQTKIFPMPFDIPRTASATGATSVANNLMDFLRFADAVERKAFLVFHKDLATRWLEGDNAKNAQENLKYVEKSMGDAVEWDGKDIIKHVEQLKAVAREALAEALAKVELHFTSDSFNEYAAFKTALGIKGPKFLSLNKVYEYWARLRSALALKGLTPANLALVLKKLEEALEHHLSFREAKRVVEQYKDKFKSVKDWPTMEEVFRHDWHSATSDFTIVRLEQSDLQVARSKMIWQEFALFGVSKAGGEVKWIFGLATDLEYPFDYERVDFLIDGTTSTNRRLSEYVAWIERLKSKADGNE